MKDNDYDVIWVRKGGIIAGYSKKTNVLEGNLEIINFQEEERFPDTTSLIDVLRAFQSLERIYVLVLGQVGGIVTRGDLQKSPVRMWLFGLISLIEMQTVQIIRDYYPNYSWMENTLDGQKKSIEWRFKQYSNANAAIDRTECLNLLEKGEIIINNTTISNKLDITKEQYNNFFKELKNLRNKVAHQQNIITRDWPGNIDLVRKAEDFLGKCEEFENK
jgi:hypothetical protein